MENSTKQSRSVIVNWLEGHPTNLGPNIPYIDAKAAKVPRWASTSKKRSVLEELVNSNMSGKRQRVSPWKGERESRAVTPGLGRAAEEFDDDATPRSRNEPGMNFPSFMAPNSAGMSDAQSWSSKSASSSRSRSPTKRLGDLQLMNTRVRAVDFSDSRFPLRADVKTLYQDIEYLSSGVAVIPDAVRTQAAHLLSSGKLHEHNFPATTNRLIPPQPPRAYIPDRAWELIEEILEEARILKQDLASEPAWNTEVHARILKLALQGWRADNWELCYVDVTTARIHKRTSSLASTAGITTTSSYKMVDYAICVCPSVALEDRIISTLRAEAFGGPNTSGSINHTRAEYVRFKPIAISIETKRPGADKGMGEIQLGVWAAAHFQRLRELAGWVVPAKAAWRSTRTKASGNGDENESNKPSEPSERRGEVYDIPLLPQVLVQGHDWRLKIAVSQDIGGLLLYGDIHMGDTRSHLGVYKILACLRQLCQWSRTHYRRWFLENCLLA